MFTYIYLLNEFETIRKNKMVQIYNSQLYFLFQLRRFQRKRKAPTPRSKPIKVSKKDVSTAAECLLQLSNQLVPEHESSSSVSLDPEVFNFMIKTY